MAVQTVITQKNIRDSTYKYEKNQKFKIIEVDEK